MTEKESSAKFLAGREEAAEKIDKAASEAQALAEFKAERRLQAMQKLRHALGGWQAVNIDAVFVAWRTLVANKKTTVEAYKRQRGNRFFKQVFRAWSIK